MSTAQDRNAQLIAAIARVCDAPIPPSAAAFSSITLEEGEAAINTRYERFDVRDGVAAMTTKELQEALWGNTIYGAPYDNDPYVLAFHPGGGGWLKLRGREMESGSWWIDEGDDTIHSEWGQAAGARDIAVRYYRTADPVVLLHEAADRELPVANWRMCLVEPGMQI